LNPTVTGHDLNTANRTKSERSSTGFTLIEVMVVIALIGIIVTLVQFNFSGKRPDDLLRQESLRFATIVEVASDYGMLNNIEIGIVIKDNSYQFLGFDGVKWAEVQEQEWLTLVEMPEGIELSLSLDDLPIEDPLLFDANTFKEKDENDFSLMSDEEKEKQIIPQIYILSGGDISPFSVTFYFNESAIALSGDDIEALAYRVTGIYSTPLTIEGPVLDE
jgi:general secretion pathway protein H